MHQIVKERDPAMNQISPIKHLNPEPETAAASTPDDAARRGRRKRLFAAFGLGLAVLGGSAYAYNVLIASHHVVTDDAYVGADVALVTPQIGGPVREVLVDDTQPVKQGDVLVRLDDIDARLALTRTDAALSAAKAQLDKARIDLRRREALAASGSVSGEELTTARNAYSAAEANLKANEAGREQARIDLERTVIRAPIDGVVSKRQVQVGQRVQPGAPLMTVVPIQAAFVDANYKEIQLAKVHPGQEATLHSDLYGSGVPFHGRVVGFSGGTGAAFAVVPAQNATGNWIKVVQRLPVRIALDPKELEQHALRVGLSMTADIHVEN
jgi:membrane fusion protein, multidrug efflux system